MLIYQEQRGFSLFLTRDLGLEGKAPSKSFMSRIGSWMRLLHTNDVCKELWLRRDAKEVFSQ